MEGGFEAQLVPVGVILKTVGYQGGLLIDTYPQYQRTWEHIDKCLIRVDGVWAPFFMVSKQEKSEGLLVVFEDLEDNKLAKSLIHQEIYVLHDQIRLNTETYAEDDEINAWIGFTVHDAHSEFSGLIQRVEEMPSQLLAYVEYQGKLIALPLTEELIVDIDPDKKSVILDLPGGILDL